jgi:TPR repeat protein
MRPVTFICVLVFGSLAGCALAGCTGLHLVRGLPVVAKSPRGSLISDAGGIPDLERGNQARLAGRVAEAERDLLPLARRGYPNAQLYLAAVYSQKQSVDAQDAAIALYRAVLPRRPQAAIALARILMKRGDALSVVEAERLLLQAQAELEEPATSAALLDLYAQFPQLDAKRRATALARTVAASPLIEVRASAINWYRSTVGAAGHARRLLELCRRDLASIPGCYTDLATYYRYSGNRAALEALVTQFITFAQRGARANNFDDFLYDPLELPQLASRFAVTLVGQPAAEELAQTDEELTFEDEAERQAQAEAADESVDSRPAPDAVPQYATPTPQPAAATTSPASIPANSQPELADKMLRWMLKQPGEMPAEAAGVAVSFPYLLVDVNLEEVLKVGVAQGVPRASLFLGELYYFNQRAPREASLGEASLRRSLQFRSTTAPGHYRLGRLYQQGYLGRPDPQKSLDNFLYAARHRVTAADTHLARLFYDSPGVRVNRINSYVFARLSADAGAPVIVHTLRAGVRSSYKLLDRLRSELTPEELRSAESLYQRELAVHLVEQPPVSPEVWVKEAG